MSLCEIVLRVRLHDPEVRLADVPGGSDGSVISVDGADWFVLMTMAPEGAEAGRRLVCVPVDGL